MIITVVRHLEPIPFSPGTNDILRPLSGEGHRKSDVLRLSVSDEFDAGFTSPYVRCVQTAQHLSGLARQWFESTELRESAHPGQEVTLRCKPLVTPESTFDLRDRVSRFLEMVHSKHDAVLVVTHGDVVNAFRWCIEGLTFTEFVGLYKDSNNFVSFGDAFVFDTGHGSMVRLPARSGAESPLSRTFPPVQDQFAYRAVPTRFEVMENML